MGDQQLHCVIKEEDGRSLYVGTQEAAKNLQLLREHGVGSILCVGSIPFHENEADLKYKVVSVLDIPTENLLVHLDSCISFLTDGLDHGKSVLVHCVYGQSRSATVAVAFLMRSGKGLEEAVSIVRRAQPTIHINPGFGAQLLLFAEMGCRLTGGGVDSPGGLNAGATYRWFLFACEISTQLNRREAQAGGCFKGKPGLTVALGEAPGLVPRYLCKACRMLLFTEANVVDHTHPICLAFSDSTYESFARHGDGSSWLASMREATSKSSCQQGERGVGPVREDSRHCPSTDLQHRSGDTGRDRMKGKGRGKRSSREIKKTLEQARDRSSWSLNSCTSIFTEALGSTGLVGDGGEHSGKIKCWGRGGLCGSKIGTWSLKGVTCSCGRTIRPAVQFTRSRVERIQSTAFGRARTCG
ncbi:unnamed protein product [Discosporangium mesarthrocarpum]